jgi:hypothetical protein
MDALVTDLKGLGAPDTESGQAIKSSIDELSTTLQGEVANIEGTVNDASGLTGIPKALASVTASLSAMDTAFTSTLQTIESEDAKGELQTALQDSPACADISSQRCRRHGVVRPLVWPPHVPSDTHRPHVPPESR